MKTNGISSNYRSGANLIDLFDTSIVKLAYCAKITVKKGL
jgi:hypothetical protein